MISFKGIDNQSHLRFIAEYRFHLRKRYRPKYGALDERGMIISLRKFI